MEVQRDGRTWWLVDKAYYPSKEVYEEMEVMRQKVVARAAANPDRYPPCEFCARDGDGHGCDCARSTILYLEESGIDHETAVSIAAVEQATQIRQYDFDGHDDAFESFQDYFVEDPDTHNTPVDPPYVQWVQDHQPAVQWAIDFADLRQYL